MKVINNKQIANLLQHILYVILLLDEN